MVSTKTFPTDPARFGIWWWWFYLTALYTALGFLRLYTLARIIGLFVPVGITSAMVGPGNIYWIVFAIIGFVIIWKVDVWAKKQQLSGGSLILTCLTTLLAVTFLIDFSWFFVDHNCVWASMQLLMDHNTCLR